jgi:hypothetical protein
MNIFTVALVLYLLLTNITAIGADIVAQRAFKPPLNPPSPQRQLDLFTRLGVMVRGA